MVLFFSIVKIKVKFVCFLRGGDYHIVGFFVKFTESLLAEQ